MDLKLDAMELRLGLPGSDDIRKSSSASLHCKRSSAEIEKSGGGGAPLQKQQVVGWPPVRSSYRKNTLHQQHDGKTGEEDNRSGAMFVKVSMDGAPYLRKIDLNFYHNYADLLTALQNMYNCNLGTGREGYSSASPYAPTYQDKDGDWMLVGDVPWEMFVASCKRMRIMRGSEAKGLQVQAPK